MAWVVVFFLGAVTGSFLNVCIFRIPKGESIIRPRSHCLLCQNPIRWHDNIPLFSFFFLKGRCRWCRAKISRQYPVIEGLTALFFLLYYGCYGLSVKGVVTLGLTLALLVMSVIDWRHQILPDGITLPGIAVGFIVSGCWPGLQGELSPLQGLKASFFGILLGGGLLYAAGTLAEKILKKEAMGGGDVKLLAMIGAFTGWAGVWWTLFVSSLAGSIVGIYLRLRTGQEKIPFGPYLALGAFTYIWFGGRVIGWYVQSMGF